MFIPTYISASQLESRDYIYISKPSNGRIHNLTLNVLEEWVRDYVSTGSLNVTSSAVIGAQINSPLSILKDENGNTSINWRNRFLIDVGENISLDWENLHLSGSWKLDTIPTVYNSIVTKGWIDSITSSIYNPTSSAVSQSGTINSTSRILYIGSLPSINWGNRILFNSVGNNVFDWNSYIIYDSSTISSIQWNDRVLYDSSENVRLNWNNGTLVNGVATLNWLNRQLSGQWKLDTSPTTIDGLATKGWVDSITSSFVGNPTASAVSQSGRINSTIGVLLDSNSDRSVDWLDRALISPDNDEESLNWNTKQLKSIDGNEVLNWRSSSLYIDGGQKTLDWSNRHLSGSWKLNTSPTTPDGIVTKGWFDNISSSLLSSGSSVTASVVVGTQMDSTARVLYDNFGVVAVLDWSAGSLKDIFNFDSLNWFSRIGYDLIGRKSISWNSDRRLFDFNETASINWETRNLYSVDGGPAVDWDSKYLYDNYAISVDWSNKELIDNSFIPSLKWVDRKLYDTIGEISIDWENLYLSGSWKLDTSPTTADGIATRGWVESISGSFSSSPTASAVSQSNIINSTTRQLYFTDGTSIDWGSRVLVDSTQTAVLFWESKDFIGNWNIYGSPASEYHIVNKGWVDSITSSFAGNPTASAVSQSNTIDSTTRQLYGSWTLNTSPSNSDGIATKGWVDSVTASLSDLEDFILGLSGSLKSITASHALSSSNFYTTRIYLTNKIYENITSFPIFIDIDAAVLGVTIPAGERATLNWGEAKLIDANSTSQSLNWENRSTYDSSSQKTIDWQNKKLYHFDETLDWKNKLLYDSGPSPVLDWENKILLQGWITDSIIPTTSGGIATKGWIDSITSSFVGNSTSSAVIGSQINSPLYKLLASSDDASVDWEMRMLYDDAPGPSLDWNNRVLSGSWELDTSPANPRSIVTREWIESISSSFSSNPTSSAVSQSTTINSSIRRLYNNTNKEVMDWQSAYIYDIVGSSSIWWQARFLLDTSEQISMNWNIRRLQDSLGSSVLEWENKQLSGSWKLDTSPTTSDGIATKGWIDSITGSKLTTIGFTIDGSPPVGFVGQKRVEYNGTIKKWVLLGNPSGSVLLDIKKSTYDSYPHGNSITGSIQVQLTSNIKSESSDLTGWNSSVLYGDIFSFHVNTVSSLTYLQLYLEIEKS